MILPFLTKAQSPIVDIQTTPPQSTQEYLLNYRSIKTEDGLAHMTTYATCKDSDGFLWVSTKYGLNRYDGYEFQLYTKAENGLFRNGIIWKIEEDQQGKIWLFYTSKGWPNLGETVFEHIDIFDPNTEQAIPIQNYITEQLPFNMEDIVFNNISESNQRVWITTKQGELFLYQQQGFKPIFKVPTGKISCLTTQGDRIWIGWEGSIACLDLNGNKSETFQFSGMVHNIWHSENKEVKIATKEMTNESVDFTLWTKPDSSSQFKPISFSENSTLLKASIPGKEFIQYSKKGLWFVRSTAQNRKNASIHILGETGQQIFQIIPDFQNKFQRPFYDYLESGNNIWLPTETYLIKIEISKNRFNIINQLPGLSDCRGINEDKAGNIYFLNGSLFSYNTYKQKVKKLTGKIKAWDFICSAHEIWGFPRKGVWANL